MAVGEEEAVPNVSGSHPTERLAGAVVRAILRAGPKMAEISHSAERAERERKRGNGRERAAGGNKKEKEKKEKKKNLHSFGACVCVT